MYEYIPNNNKSIKYLRNMKIVCTVLSEREIQIERGGKFLLFESEIKTFIDTWIILY